MSHLAASLELIKEQAAQFAESNNSQSLYQPISYLMSLGGKRLRPALALLACQAFGGNEEDALSAALGIEVFHNFTLMHDDIMDNAPLRRGKETVHEKWNVNTAILSGDAMLVQSYQLMAKSPPALLPLVLERFSATALEVCEGQQLDMEFEERMDVTIDEYLEMIRLKTSVLLAASLEIGALIGGASSEDASLVYKFGESLGIAFQLRDDYLDAFGEEDKVGKQIGGDILADKKTFLLINAWNEANESDKELLRRYVGSSSHPSPEKIKTIKEIMVNSGSDRALLEKSNEFYEAGMASLKKLSKQNEYTEELKAFASMLMERDH